MDPDECQVRQVFRQALDGVLMDNARKLPTERSARLVAGEIEAAARYVRRVASDPDLLLVMLGIAEVAG